MFSTADQSFPKKSTATGAGYQKCSPVNNVSSGFRGSLPSSLNVHQQFNRCTVIKQTNPHSYALVAQHNPTVEAHHVKCSIEPFTKPSIAMASGTGVDAYHQNICQSANSPARWVECGWGEFIVC